MEYHFPGQEFTGPGTRVITKIINGVQPVNKTDFATMLHDIQYLQLAGASKQQISHSDDLAMSNAGNDLAGIATKIGLTARKILGLRFDTPITDKSYTVTNKIGDMLMHKVKKDYKPLFNKYNVNINDY